MLSICRNNWRWNPHWLVAQKPGDEPGFFLYGFDRSRGLWGYSLISIQTSAPCTDPHCLGRTPIFKNDGQQACSDQWIRSYPAAHFPAHFLFGDFLGGRNLVMSDHQLISCFHIHRHHSHHSQFSLFPRDFWTLGVHFPAHR